MKLEKEKATAERLESQIRSRFVEYSMGFGHGGPQGKTAVLNTEVRKPGSLVQIAMAVLKNGWNQSWL